MKLPIQVSSSRSRIERLSMTVLPQRRNLTWGRQANAPDLRGFRPLVRFCTDAREACATDWPMPFDPTPDPQPLISVPALQAGNALAWDQPYNSGLELFTFECTKCGHLECPARSPFEGLRLFFWVIS
jgi:hypothetical protein